MQRGAILTGRWDEPRIGRRRSRAGRARVYPGARGWRTARGVLRQFFGRQTAAKWHLFAFGWTAQPLPLRRRGSLAAAGILTLLGLVVLVDARTSLRAENSEKRTWRLTIEADQPRLDYGTNNEEDTPIAFFCKAGRGLVEVSIAETGKGVKPGRSMMASLTAGSTVSKVRGKTMPNEEAGTPSFLGTQPADDPLFATLSKERVLVFVVGPSRQQVPLRDIGDKADRFSRLCRKQ